MLLYSFFHMKMLELGDSLAKSYQVHIGGEELLVEWVESTNNHMINLVATIFIIHDLGSVSQRMEV